MEIPLKSQPKVSTVNLIDDSKFHIDSNNNHSNSRQNSQTAHEGRQSQQQTDSEQRHAHKSGLDYQKSRHTSVAGPFGKLETATPTTGFRKSEYRRSRGFSETEKNNFDSETGHRIYQDGTIRPQTVRQESSTEFQPYNEGDNDNNGSNKLHARSHDSSIDVMNYTRGLEDEYIPGLDFSDMVYKWNNNSDLDLTRTRTTTSTMSAYTTQSNTPRSHNASYLDLNLLHAQVAPQPIRHNSQIPSKHSYSKLHDYMKMKRPGHEGQSTGPKDTEVLKLKQLAEQVETPSHSPKRETSGSGLSMRKSKKQKASSTALDSQPGSGGDVDFEAILHSLPPNFNDLPYSQRKKVVRNFSESVDYSQFSLFAKNYLNGGGGFGSFGSSKTPKSDGGFGSNDNSFTKKQRVGSVNTLAGRLLARTSTTDIKKLQEMNQKYNVDERGAIVMEHELGKCIGYGAWGTIRECVDKKGNIRAMKIVKSTRDFEFSCPGSRRNSRVDMPNVTTNPKVLEVFKKEISIWKQLHHDNILPLIDHFETEDTIFCLMDRIEGGTLFDVVTMWGQFNGGLHTHSGPINFSIEKQRQRMNEIIDYTRQVVTALLYMHEEKGIVHGDIKLENVLVRRDKDDHCKMILCDFGMARIYSMRISRKNSMKYPLKMGSNRRRSPPPTSSPQLLSPEDDNDDMDTLMIRSKSSNTENRKPYPGGGDGANARTLDYLINDDSQIGVSNFFKTHGPSIQSVHLTPVSSEGISPTTSDHKLNQTARNTSNNDCFEFSKKWLSSQANNDNGNNSGGVGSDLPHSHIGSLPYASPELLQPSPPPLGPSADVWALGVLMYAMCVGKLPFQHQYEPRLRAMITAGKYNKAELRKACLMEWVLKDESKSKEGSSGKNSKESLNRIDEGEEEADSKDDVEDESIPAALMMQSPSMVDLKRQEELNQLRDDWKSYKSSEVFPEFTKVYDIVVGCLETNITKRWDTQMIYDYLS
ncbi:hypothetical protein CORT_0A10610 [Candida orthopsilosis Co 90-125]|uniref:Protein kinase domain-containing protein n=1 Tax=Candida orthopsilosis (strain 90-125) TaxID=1136231 RepID=H8WXE1_CANO9|nr:hypothetical protein CORT_0A10610 [Candida orthopsilosis Co 90-125]CCG21447.1 hypothetical protein CORT_0A10610 [Candida orthopsilosis Co 90-125]